MNYQIVYHGPNCPDGWLAAVIAAHKLDHCELIPCTPGNIPFEKLNKKLVVLDLSLKEEDVNKILEIDSKAVICDHHKTCFRHPRVIYDVNESGASLAWKHFMDSEFPALVRYVKDRDIWKWKEPHSHEINEGIYHELDIGNYEQWLKYLLNDKKVMKLKKVGKILLKSKKKQILNSAKTAYYCKGMYRGYIINSGTSIRSDIGNHLLKYPHKDHKPQLVVFWRYAHGFDEIWVSIRSKIDCTKLIKKYGGGGHAKAGGCSFKSLTEFNEFLQYIFNEKLKI